MRYILAPLGLGLASLGMVFLILLYGWIIAHQVSQREGVVKRWHDLAERNRDHAVRFRALGREADAVGCDRAAAMCAAEARFHALPWWKALLNIHRRKPSH